MRVTSGSYPTEAESIAEFDRIVEAGGLFRVYREVEGHYMTHRPGRELKRPRIDRILVPLKQLREQGWTATIGIEAKRSGSKLGPLVCQALDYSWAIYDCGGTHLHPEAIFLWPVRKDGIDGETIYSAIESVMVQNRIGWCSSYRGDEIGWNLGAIEVLNIKSDGASRCRADVFGRAGRKVGSR